MFHEEHSKMKKTKQYIEVTDSFLSKKSFALLLNKTNEVLNTFPKPSKEELPDYYNSSQYLSHKNKGSSLFAKIYFASRKWMVYKKKQISSSLCPVPGRIVDVGSGTGDFLMAHKKNGWQAVGIEPNREAKAIAEKKKISHIDDLSQVKKTSQDVITFWHSLEHVYDLEETLGQARRALKNQGYLIVACPNYMSWDAEYYGQNWAAWDVPRHLRHFSPNSLNLILNKKGFSQIIKKPLVLDAFYISVLSEKIQGSSLSFLKGIFFGLISNLSGLITGNYSSQIYIFQKKS